MAVRIGGILGTSRMTRSEDNTQRSGPVGVERTLRVLLRSESPLAGTLLTAAVDSTLPELRLGAIRAIARRTEIAEHAALVDAWPRLDAAARAALAESDARTQLRANLEPLLRDPEVDRRANVAEVALACRSTETLPAVVEAACDASGPVQRRLAEVALGLAKTLRQQIDAGVSGGRDPAFARRAAVNALAAAVNAYGRHRCDDLVRAFLLLTPYNEPAFSRALHNLNDPAHDALIDALRACESSAIGELLAAGLKDLSAPTSLLEIAATHREPDALGRLMHAIGLPIGARVTQNASRIEEFAWADPDHRGVLLRLDGEAQGAAVQLAAASGLSRREVAAIVRLLLEAGEERGRFEAARAIDRLPDHLGHELLQIALLDESPPVAARAAKQLRRKGLPDATATLVDLLDHEAAEVRAAAQDELPEMRFPAYRDDFDAMSTEEQQAAGAIVAKADPDAAAALLAELTAGPAERRIRALDMVEKMDLVGLLLDSLLDRVDDGDTGVRVEVARMLGNTTPSPPVVRALRGAAADASPAVRSVARASLFCLGVESREDET